MVRSPDIRTRSVLFRVFTSALGVRAALAVVTSIVIIEAVILVPSYFRYERDLLARLHTEYDALIRGTSVAAEAGGLPALAAGMEALVASRDIEGYAILDDDGASLGRGGDSAGLQLGPEQTSAAQSRDLTDRRRVDLTVAVPGQADAAWVAIRTSTVRIDDALMAFVWRIAGLVLLISAIVSAATLFVVDRLFLKPMLNLRNSLRAAVRDLDNADHYIADTQLEHELGDVKAALNDLLKRLQEYRRLSQKQSDERFRDFGASASDWFWEMDSGLRFSYFSARFEEVTGVEPSQLLGKTREETGIPNVDPAAWQEHLDNLHQRRAFRDFRHPRTKPDGSVVHLSINGKPVFDDDGSFMGFRGTGSDITALVNYEQSLMAEKEKAEYADRAKSEFLANMSHELRTPLNAIIGFSTMVKDGYFGPVGNAKYREYARDIHDSAQHLLSIINDILDLSKVEAGEDTVERSWFGLSDLLDASVNLVRSRAAARDIALQLDYEAPVQEIYTDKRKLKQIVINFLTNAVKFSVEGGTVRLKAEVDESDALVISVEDEGIGIPASHLETIFDPFVQVKSALSSGHEGTGLGLPLCKRLSEVLDGDIELTSEVDAGTRIQLRLPARACLQVEDAASLHAAALPRGAAKR